MDNLSFTKMHGAGNDFVVVDNREETYPKGKLIALTPKLCHRRYGIGADGLLLLMPPSSSKTDYTMLYRNADGSDAGMCGNGARCLALYAAVKADMGQQLRFQVHDAFYEESVKPRQQYVTVSFPMQVEVKEIEMEGEPRLYQTYPGTEHITQKVTPQDFERDDMLIRRGRNLRHHKEFSPAGTNVNFIYGDTSNAINIKTYERGVEDLTLACGTGAIASAITWHHIQQQKDTTSPIAVHAEGGTLDVQFNYDGQNNCYNFIKLGGKATIVFNGSYAI